MQTQEDTNHAEPTRFIVPIVLATMTLLATSSFLLAGERYGPSVQWAGAAGLVLVPLAALELLAPRSAGRTAILLAAFGLPAFLLLQWFWSIEMPGERWLGLRLAMAGVHTLPVILGPAGFLLGRRLWSGPAGRWGLGLALALLAVAIIPIAGLFLVCSFGYDCL